MVIKRVTQLELEDFVQVQKIDDDPESGVGIQALSAAEVRKRSAAAQMTLRSRFEDGEQIDWADSYHQLINAGWPWRIAAWVAWMTMPKGRRWPKTQQDLAVDVLGLTSDRTIAAWRKKYPTLDQLIADLQADDMLDTRGDVLHALKTSASDPNYKHSPDRRLYLTMTGDYVEHKKLDLGKKSKGTLKELSDAELDALSGDPEKVRILLEQLRNEAKDDDDSNLDE